MDLLRYINIVAESEVADWVPILQPTYRNRFLPRRNAAGVEIGLSADQHRLHLTFRRDIRISLGFGLVENGNYEVPAPNRFADENAVTQLLDCFWEGRLAFRDSIVRIGRNRCLLPEPPGWADESLEIPNARYALARLVHEIAGPPTHFDEYFSLAGMRRVDRRWPVTTAEKGLDSE